MGKCISKNKNPKCETIRQQKEDIICTPVCTEGSKNVALSYPKPNLIVNNDNADTQMESNRYITNVTSSTIVNNEKGPSSLPSKFFISLNQLAKKV